ncbi:ECF-type sigma factor [Lachnospiraceae bacterium 29-84]
MAYNHGREDRKWRIWKEAEEKLLRECGVDEATIEQIRTDDRADFNSNRRFYRWASNFGEYLEGMADREKQAEVKSVSDLLDEIENETLYLALVTVDRRTLQIILLKMQGYSTKEIAASVKLSTKSVYRRMEKLRSRLKSFKR